MRVTVTLYDGVNAEDALAMASKLVCELEKEKPGFSAIVANRSYRLKSLVTRTVAGCTFIFQTEGRPNG